MSAKSGDQVKQVFLKVATTLAGINIDYQDLEAEAVVLPATIVDHQRYVIELYVCYCYHSVYSSDKTVKSILGKFLTIKTSLNIVFVHYRNTNSLDKYCSIK